MFQCSSASRKFGKGGVPPATAVCAAVSVLFCEPKIRKIKVVRLVIRGDEPVSVLFCEPKIRKIPCPKRT